MIYQNVHNKDNIIVLLKCKINLVLSEILIMGTPTIFTNLKCWKIIFITKIIIALILSIILLLIHKVE